MQFQRKQCNMTSKDENKESHFFPLCKLCLDTSLVRFHTPDTWSIWDREWRIEGERQGGQLGENQRSVLLDTNNYMCIRGQHPILCPPALPNRPLLPPQCLSCFTVDPASCAFKRDLELNFSCQQVGSLSLTIERSKRPLCLIWIMAVT